MAKFKIIYSKAYKKAIKRLTKYQLELAENVLDKLANDETLEPKYNDHQLKGGYKDFRECHIKPDLLLIYHKQKDLLVLTCLNIGSHTELF